MGAAGGLLGREIAFLDALRNAGVPVPLSEVLDATRALGAVDLLDRIVGDTDASGDPPLLAAIADGTFGLMKRPADRGKGLEGVVERAEGYDNPASTALDAWVLEQTAGSEQP